MWLLLCKLAGIEILLSIGPPLVSLHGLSYFVGILLQLSVFMLQILNFVVTMTKRIKTMVFYGLRISNQSAVPRWVEIEDCHVEHGCADHIYTCLCWLHCKRTQPRRVIFKTTETPLKSWYLLSWQSMLWVTIFIQKTDTILLLNWTLQYLNFHFLQSALDSSCTATTFYMKVSKYPLPGWTTVWSRFQRPPGLDKKKTGNLLRDWPEDLNRRRTMQMCVLNGNGGIARCTT
jgi:hypothetical protein